jgi:hypothetical protein
MPAHESPLGPGVFGVVRLLVGVAVMAMAVVFLLGRLVYDRGLGSSRCPNANDHRLARVRHFSQGDGNWSPLGRARGFVPGLTSLSARAIPGRSVGRSTIHGVDGLVGQKDRVTGGFGELLDTGRDVDGVADQSNSSLPPPRFEARRRIARFVAGPDAPSRWELQRLWQDR